MKYWLILTGIMFLMPVISLAASGDTIQSGTEIEENFMWSQANRVTVSQGTQGYIYQGQDASGDEYDITLVWLSAGDSLDGWVTTGLTLGIVCNGSSGSWGAGDSLFLYVAKRNVREIGCWNYFKSSGDPAYDSVWTTAGGLDGTDDFWQAIDSVSANISSGDTVTFDIIMAADSQAEWLTGNTSTSLDHLGFIVRVNNAAKAAGKQLNFVADEAIGSVNEPFIVATYTLIDTMSIEPAACNMTNGGTNDAIYVGTYAHYSYNANVDSVNVHLQDGSGSDDSVRVVIYRAYGDSALVDSSDAIYEADGGSACEEISFVMDCSIKGDSSYFWGIIHYDEGASTVSFCRVGGGSSGDAIIDIQTSIPANVQGATAGNLDYAPCFKAYLSFPVASTSQVIIIGSCESEDTPYSHGDMWCSVPDRDLTFKDVE